MPATGALARGRRAFADGAWRDAYVELSSADRQTPLGPADLDCLATAAYLLGQDAVSVDVRARAHSGHLERGETVSAIRSAFWLAFVLLDKPDQQAQARGWLARVRRLLDEQPHALVEEGLWLCATGFFQAAVEGALVAACETFGTAAQIGTRFKDPSVTALARHGEGRALIGLGRTAEGLAIFDEVMVSVTCGEVAPMIAGVVYCSVIGACHDIFDLRRAHEWTAALSVFCTAHPDMVSFHGQCLIRRSELLQIHGAWQEALGEAERATARLTSPAQQRDAGQAFYQQGELLRLHGEFEKAEEAYRRANLAGWRPDPGLAYLRLAQGRRETAVASIRRALQEIRNLRMRAHLLRAAVEIMLEIPDVDAAAHAADELSRLAARFDAPFLRAAAAQATGVVALAHGNSSVAVEQLRLAWTCWADLDAPYEVARVRTTMGIAFRQLGDEDGARLEFDAAQETFDELGAAPDLARLAALVPAATPAPAGGLTGREVAVLRLVATGMSNRLIAAELEISEKTVARHLSNIFTKLDLPSRSAATAYAYEHKLV